MKSAIFGLVTRRPRLAGAIGLVCAGLLGGVAAVQAADTDVPAYLGTFPDFNPAVTAQMPGDVDMALKKRLENQKLFAQVQREFDLYSWQMFLALNWPTNDAGQAAQALTDGADPAWSRWAVSSSIFRADGARPAACGRPHEGRTAVASRDLAHPISPGLRPFSAAAAAGAHPRKTRFLGVISAVGELHGENLDEIGQAFTGPLIDRNGEFVFYEILVDPNEVKYLCDNNLYNINGQVAFSKKFGKNPPRVVFPSGADGKDWSGAFEVKLAWKILTPGKDDASRFYTTDAVVMDPQTDGTTRERKVKVGLVGMHIGHKSLSSPQWIWSTFEQIDNVEVDQVAHPKVQPSFFDPNCWTCAVNQQPAQVGNSYPRTPVQAWRAISIPPDKQALNRQAQAALRRLGSVWQYYQLIDTQWPTVPSAKPSPWNGGMPDAVENKPGGRPTPVFLTNITMETYFQGANVSPPGAQINQMNQPACNGTEAQGDCSPVWNGKAGDKQGQVGTNPLIFATESCMGCHSSAGIYTSYTSPSQNTQSGQLSGDFSWLLSQKASFQGGGQPAAPLAGKRRQRRSR